MRDMPLFTISLALAAAVQSLRGCSATPRLDAELLLAYLLGVQREYLMIHDDELITAEQMQRFNESISARRDGTPIAYLTGTRAFYNRNFKVNPDVLIPRPETEHLVEAAITWARATYNTTCRPLNIIDVGTGSGIIGIMLAAQFPYATVTACDISRDALQLASENAGDLQNITFVQSDLVNSIDGTFDLIAANLPYIPTAEMHALDVARHEPHLALDGGADGLDLIRRLLNTAPMRLNRPGLLLMEHASDQGQAILALGQAAFPDAQVEILKDYGKLDRVLRVQLT